VQSILKSLWIVFVGLAVSVIPMSGQANWKVVNTFHVGGEGSWDYVTMDPSHHRLFVTRSTHTQAIDEVTGAVLGDIPGQIRSHGVALAPSLGRGFITDGGGTGAIIVFDLNSYAVLGKIPAVPGADGIIYDEKLNRVLAVSGEGNELLTFSPDIDPTDGKLDPPIALGGGPEFFASDGSGKVYVDLEDKNLVAVIDLNTRKVVAKWAVAPGGHPVAMAIDPVGRRLFIGCRNPQMLVVMNADSGAIEASLPIGARVDTTRFDAGEAFASAGDGTLAVASQKDGKWIVQETVATPKGARTMGLDSSTQKIYLPTAEFEPGTTTRPTPKPDTFMIVEVGR
jgi:DNA-binding beta-propeller fold protein YncE